MHRVDTRTYTGAPGEQVTVTATVAGSGSIKFVLDGQDRGGSSPLTFSMPSSPGQSSKLSIALFGAPGETCLVETAVVDGGSDRDLLVAQQGDPFPVHHFQFTTLAATQLGMAATLQQGKGGK